MSSMIQASLQREETRMSCEIQSVTAIILMPFIWLRMESSHDTSPSCTFAFHAILAGPIPWAILPVTKLDTRSMDS